MVAEQFPNTAFYNDKMQIFVKTISGVASAEA